jgi:hypothetical protein
MNGTSILSGRGSALTVLTPAAGGLSGIAEVEWVGPFDPGQVTLPGQTVTVGDDQVITVATSNLRALAAGNPNWWVVV